MGGGELGDEPSCSVGGRLHHVLQALVQSAVERGGARGLVCMRRQNPIPTAPLYRLMLEEL